MIPFSLSVQWCKTKCAYKINVRSSRCWLGNAWIVGFTSNTRARSCCCSWSRLLDSRRIPLRHKVIFRFVKKGKSSWHTFPKIAVYHKHNKWQTIQQILHALEHIPKRWINSHVKYVLQINSCKLKLVLQVYIKRLEEGPRKPWSWQITSLDC